MVEELVAPGTIIGVTGAIRTPEVGYLFHKDTWGKGYATEALAAFMPLLWNHMGQDAPKDARYDYATAFTDPENKGSQRVLEKCGFALSEITLQDFQSPTLGLRDTAAYRAERPLEK